MPRLSQKTTQTGQSRPRRRVAPARAKVTADRLALALLERAATKGWQESCLEEAARALGLADYALLFPRGLDDAAAAVAAYADVQMLTAAKLPVFARAKVRDKIAQLVWARLSSLAPYRAGVRALVFWAVRRPDRGVALLQRLWGGADVAWRAAGDTATDFNHYTKRGLLCWVIGSTGLFWLRDESAGQAESRVFLERRIADVLRLGGLSGQAKDLLAGLWSARARDGEDGATSPLRRGAGWLAGRLLRRGRRDESSMRTR